MSPRKRGSLPFIWAGRHRPAQAAYPFRLLRCLRIHAGRMMRMEAILIGTYLALQPIRFTRAACHHDAPWALTPRFHPCHAGGVAVVFCGTRCPFPRKRESLPPNAGLSFPLGSMAPCVVPTFLPLSGRERQSGPPAAAKIRQISASYFLILLR